jgi:triacylglycerol lipase
MYYPPSFDVKKAIELGNLVKQAYEQFQFYKNGLDWKLKGDYNLVSVISYNRWQMGFDAEEDTGPTLIDKEMLEIGEVPTPEGPVSFGILDSLKKEYPMGFIATSKNGKNVYLIFRGTVTPQEFVKDAKIKMQPYFISNWGNVALGFFEVYMACRESFVKTVDGLGDDMNLYISGHSLGAALSVLSLPDVAKSTHFKKPVLYNFGCPRVGDNDFVTAYNALPSQKTFRIANSSDLVTSIPLPVPMLLVPSGYYSHADVPVGFNIQKNDIGLNHSMDTYVTALGG